MTQATGIEFIFDTHSIIIVHRQNLQPEKITMSCQEEKPGPKLNVSSLKEFRWKKAICWIAGVTCLITVVILALIFGSSKIEGEFS